MKEYLLKQAKVRSYKVVINKLTPQTILEWSGKHKPTWQDLDPYSSLEDVGDTGNDTASSITDENAPPRLPHYELRARSSRKQNSNRPVRMATQSLSYTDMFQFKNKKSKDFMQSCFPFFVYFKCCSDFLLYFYKCSTSMAFT